MSAMSVDMINDSSNFNASIVVSEQLNRLLISAAQDLAIRAVTHCASEYHFDADTAIRSLGLCSLKVSRKAMKVKPVREVVVKPSFPLPYSGEMLMSCCQALRQNNGLYTQCQMVCKSGSYCKGCQLLADKSADGIPEYGTITQRLAVGILEYVDPKGRRPVAYTKVMKKYKVSKEQVLEEAGKFNMSIAPIHFVVAESVSKRGRPKTEKVAKDPKGAKGRPKKSKKVLEVEDDEDDLFASLVANANSSDDEEEAHIEVESQPMKKKGKSEEEKEAERVAKEEAKAAKEAQRQLEKAQKKQAEEEAKAQKKQAEEEAKAAKEAQRQLEKSQKEAKKKADEEAKSAKAAKSAKPSKAAKVVAAVEEEEEEEVIRKIVLDGVKYLKSTTTGIIYDYGAYVKNNDNLIVLGKWNNIKNRIDFETADSEEEEDDYEESVSEAEEEVAEV
jgi:hypothetical protein